MTGPEPPTGERIASEVEREMEERLYRLRHVVLAPAEYHIYLHPADFKHIEDVAPESRWTCNCASTRASSG